MATNTNDKGRRKPLTNRTVTYEPAGPSGNAYWILGKTIIALKESGHADKVDEYQKDATSGNYRHLLNLCCALSYVASFCFSSYLLALGPPFTT